MIFLSPAKLNLFLQIKGKDEFDNYHFIKSIFEPVSLYDIIDINLIKKRQIVIYDKLKKLNIDKKDNLIYKAIKVFDKYHKLNAGVSVKLYKYIPDGAGLGGGSSNAATILLSLNKLLRVNFNKKVLIKMAQEIGSDVPFFIYKKPAIVSGKGEKITFLKRKKKLWYVILTPKNIKISTKRAYSLFDNNKKTILTNNTQYNTIKKIIEKGIYTNPTSALYNDFEPVILKKNPELLKVKKYLLKFSSIVSLSGSGSSMFAMFFKKEDAKKCFIDVTTNFQDFFSVLAHSI